LSPLRDTKIAYLLVYCSLSTFFFWGSPAHPFEGFRMDVLGRVIRLYSLPAESTGYSRLSLYRAVISP